jgi:hypothetical protein
MQVVELKYHVYIFLDHNKNIQRVLMMHFLMDLLLEKRNEYLNKRFKLNFDYLFYLLEIISSIGNDARCFNGQNLLA